MNDREWTALLTEPAKTTIENGRLIVNWTADGKLIDLSWSPHTIDDIDVPIAINNKLKELKTND